MRILKHKNVDYSEVSLSELGQEMRFDADYWEPSYLKNEDIITAKNHSKTKSIAPNPQYGISVAMNEEAKGYSILKMDNIMELLADDNDAKFAEVSEKTFKQFQLKKFDVLFNRVNSDEFVGRTGIYLMDGVHTFASYLVRVDSGKPFTNCYLATYLNCKYGKTALQRVKRRAVNQANINAKELSNLNIPTPSETLQKEIQALLVDAQKQKILSEKLYSEAEDILLTELGLVNWKPKSKKFKYFGLSFVVDDSITSKSFSEVIKNWRFDAEHWEPQYDDIIKAFNKFPRRAIGSLVIAPVASGATPKAGGDDYTNADDGYPFLRAVDLINGRVITSDFLYIKERIHKGMLKRTQLKKDDVLVSIAGTVGRAAIFDHSFEANINQALCILRLADETTIKRLFLVTLFNSFVGKKFVAKTARQGLQTNLNLKEISALEIPIIDIKVQKKISDTVLKSFAAIDKSKNNIQTSIRAVEIFIEQDEKESLKYIKNVQNKVK